MSNKDKGPWLTINVCPPVLDKKIALRTADKFGYGCGMEIAEFDSKQFDEDQVIDYLETTDFIEWFELPV